MCSHLVVLIAEMRVVRVARVHGQPHEVVVLSGACGVLRVRAALRRARRCRAALAIALVTTLCALAVDNMLLNTLILVYRVITKICYKKLTPVGP